MSKQSDKSTKDRFFLTFIWVQNTPAQRSGFPTKRANRTIVTDLSFAVTSELRRGIDLDDRLVTLLTTPDVGVAKCVVRRDKCNSNLFNASTSLRFGSRADLSSVGHKVRFLSEGDIKKKFLSSFPDYVEPSVAKQIDGVEKTIAEKLLMYVAVARFAVSRPPQSIDFERVYARSGLRSRTGALDRRSLKKA